MFEPDRLKHLLDEPLKAARAEPFTLESLIAWLETKDPAAEYCYSNVEGCLWAKYVFEHGGKIDFDCNPIMYRVGTERLDVAELDNGWRDAIARRGDQTHGAALKRARTFLLQANAVSGSPSNLLAAGV